MVEADVPLFSYGTLQLPAAQLATFGRLLEGAADSLTGHRLVPLTISSDDVVALSGAAVHQIAVPTAIPGDRVPGIVFLLTSQEIEAADRYEVDAYGRIEVALASGRRAFVYVGGELPPGPSA